ncbi:hypothetical protein GM3709_2867 [Geminocystis sp. NIES-3709]|nr:hypothetical protein GM3709_2867 [Geminocystis sp. NIES-3709]
MATFSTIFLLRQGKVIRINNGNKSISDSFESIIITFPYSLFPIPFFLDNFMVN